VILVAILTVQQDSVDDYRAYERRAATIMADHGATIERTVVVPSEPHSDTFKEVHIVRFPDSDALAAYRADARYIALAPIRERVVVSTEVLVGEDGPDYGFAPSPVRR
jgi:uncharacterized protein (DUF1330 family)